MISDCWQSKRIIYYFIKSVQIITCQRNYFSKLFLLNTILIRHFHPLCCLFMLPDYQGLHDQEKTQTKTQNKPILTIFYTSPEFAGTLQCQRYLIHLKTLSSPCAMAYKSQPVGHRQAPGGVLLLTHHREVSGAPGGRNCSGHNRMKSIHFSRIKSWHMIFLHMKYTEFQPTWLYNRQFFLIMEIGW